METIEMKEILKDLDYALTLTSSDTPWSTLATQARRVAEELDSRAQAAYYDKKSAEKCPYCNASTVVKNSRGVWCETCEKDIYYDDIAKGY